MDEVNTSSSSNNLLWLWVVEALAEFKELDIAHLYDFLSRVSESSDDSWSRNASERLALRHLEDLLGGSSIRADANNDPSNSVGIHVLERAEDVFFRLLKKMATSSPSMSRQELFKSDVRQFILQKRAGLPKCALQQLKDVILEGNHPYAKVLRKRSGVDRQYQYSNRIPENNGDPDEAAEMLDQNTNKVEIEAPKENLTDPTPENGNKLLQEDPFTKYIKCTRKDLAKQYQVRSPDGNRICLDRIDNAAKAPPKQSMKDGEFHSMNEDLAPLTTENTNEDVQGLPETILLSGKEEQLVGCLGIDAVSVESGGNHPDAKKHTHSGVLGPMCKNSDHLLHVNDLIQDSQGRNSVSTEREEDDLAKATQIHDQQRNGISLDDGDNFEFVISKRIKCSTNGCEIQQEQSQLPLNEGKIPQKALSDGSHQNTCIYDARDNVGNCNKPGTLRGNFGNPDKAPDIDSDEDMLIAAEKHSFLISQNTFNQDSQRTSDWTEQSLCISCNQGVQLLICCARSCPIAVHESCVGSSASFDDKGDFYCPFCSFAQATSAYRETRKKAALLKEKAALKRKHLSKFMRMLHVHEQNQPSDITPPEGPRLSTMVADTEFLNEILGSKHERERTHSQSMCIGLHQQAAAAIVEHVDGDALDRGAPMCQIRDRNNVSLTRGEYHQKQVKNHQDRIVVEDREPPEPSSVHLRDDLSLREKEMTIACKKAPDASPSKKRSKAKMDEERQSKMAGEERRQLRVRKNNAANSPCTDTKTIIISREQADVEIENSKLQHLLVDPPQGSSSHLSENAEDAVESETNDGISFELRRRRKPAKRYSNRVFPCLRRKKVPWTVEEEEILKEGVRKFSSADEKWKKILEFGQRTFQDNRTTIDLKDKWRNMTKNGMIEVL